MPDMTMQTSPRKNKVYAVITGDIVGSTKLSHLELAAVRETIVRSVREFSLSHLNEVYRTPEFFQGDSWQLPLEEPRRSLQVALLIQAQLLAAHNVWTRAAIGIGTADGLEKTTAISTGEAFTLSGRALQNTHGTHRLTGAVPGHTGPMAQWFPGTLHLCSALIRGWSQRQAKVIGLWLSAAHPTYEWIAANLTPSIAKQSVGDILISANLPALREIFAIFQNTNWQQLANPENERNAR